MELTVVRYVGYLAVWLGVFSVHLTCDSVSVYPAIQEIKVIVENAFDYASISPNKNKKDCKFPSSGLSFGVLIQRYTFFFLICTITLVGRSNHEVL